MCPAARPPRADAARNRQKILEAARGQIAVYGPDAGMDEIAAVAGVAVGTLYRHFPNKTELVTAVVTQSVGALADETEAALARIDAGARAIDELSAFLNRVVEAAVTDKAVKAAAHALGADVSGMGAEERGIVALNAIISAGQAEGDLNPDVTVEDMYLIFGSAPTDLPPRARARWLSLILSGLTAPRTAG